MSDVDDIRTDQTLNDRPEEENVIPQKETEDQDAYNDSVIQTESEDKPEAEEKDEKPPKKPFKVPLFAAVIAVLAVAVLTSQITFLSVRQSYHKKLATIEKERFSDSKLTELDTLYRTYYINDIDETDLINGLIEGYIYGAGDKYGSYMTPEEYAEYTSSLNADTKGIGATVIWNSAMQAIEIVYVYEGSPAEEAGIEIGDLIVEVDGKAVSELGYNAGVSAVKGEAGTKAKLTVKRGDNYEQTLQIESERREFKVRTVTFKAYGEVAVIGITNFYSTTPTELKAVVMEAAEAGCDRIVFDLRNNPGGLLTSVQAVLDYILPEGVVVRRVNAQGVWDEYVSDASCLQMPMVVLVNGQTASAAELFTSALKDFDYATIIGTQTYGKGTVTLPYQLSDGSVVYISMEHYYPPKSDNFEGVGITPDEIVELDEEAKKISFYKLTYETDNQLRRAIEIIKEK